MWRLNNFVLQMSEEVEKLTLALRARHGHVVPPHDSETARRLQESMAELRQATPDDLTVHALTATVNKLALAQSCIGALAVALDDASAPSELAKSLDLDLFRQDAPRGLGVVIRHLRWRSPALRYAIRLSLAMTTGFALTLLFPQFAHANWVLLTIALIMRANYSVTSQRRWDRVTGTLIGCALAVTFLNTLPAPALLLLIVMAVGTSHAYGQVAYRITAIGASVSSLLLLHFVDPLVHPHSFERIVDTLIGRRPVLALQLSVALLGARRPAPHRARLLAADAAFRRGRAVARPVAQRIAWRARKRWTRWRSCRAPSAGWRMSPTPTGALWRRWANCWAPTICLASDLYVHAGSGEVRRRSGRGAAADASIAATRERVMALLDPGRMADDSTACSPPSDSLTALRGSAAMDVLGRRWIISNMPPQGGAAGGAAG
jgi:uncharacterized membrane protein YccC